MDHDDLRLAVQTHHRVTMMYGGGGNRTRVRSRTG